MSNEHSCGGGVATLQSPASTGSSGLGGGWFMADPGIGSPSSYSPPSPSEASVVVNVLQSPLASLPGSVLLSVLIGMVLTSFPRAPHTCVSNDYN
jgi:hypothetical protein